MSELTPPRALTEEQSGAFAEVAGGPPGVGSSRHIFDHEVVAPPCRFPCDHPQHVHQWPAEFLQKLALDQQEVIDYTGGN